MLGEESEHIDTIRDYLKKVANLISTEKDLYTIGIALKQTIDDIKRIRADNIRDLSAAAHKVLQMWVTEANIVDFATLDHHLRKAFKEAKLADLFSRFKEEEAISNTGTAGIFSSARKRLIDFY